jgi:hypothetical protein
VIFSKICDFLEAVSEEKIIFKKLSRPVSGRLFFVKIVLDKCGEMAYDIAWLGNSNLLFR